MADVAFVFDGEEAPIPDLGSFNMDEAVVLYEHCGLSLEDFAVDEDDPEQVAELAAKTKHPGFIVALLQVAYMRLRPGVNRKRAEAIAKSYGLTAAYEAIIEAGLDADPTEPQKNDESSKESTASEPGNGSASGDGSGQSSDADMSPPASTMTNEDEVALSDAPEQTQLPIGTSG